MAETDVTQGTSANGAQGQDEQIAHEPGVQQPSIEAPAAPAAPEDRTGSHKRRRIIAFVALLGSGAIAAIRRIRRTKAQHRRERRWPVMSAMLTRRGRSRRAASSARPRKLRCR
jgi:hypothetical protein